MTGDHPAWAVDRARALGLDPPPSGVAAAWFPTFHPALAVRLVALGPDGWWLEAFTADRDRLDRRLEAVLAPADGDGLVARVAAAAAGPRSVRSGEVRDGLTGVAWVADDAGVGTLAGHFALLGADDPLRRVTTALLAAVEAHAPGPVDIVRSYL